MKSFYLFAALIFTSVLASGVDAIGQSPGFYGDLVSRNPKPVTAVVIGPSNPVNAELIGRWELATVAQDKKLIGVEITASGLTKILIQNEEKRKNNEVTPNQLSDKSSQIVPSFRNPQWTYDEEFSEFRSPRAMAAGLHSYQPIIRFELIGDQLILCPGTLSVTRKSYRNDGAPAYVHRRFGDEKLTLRRVSK
ncbi:hypothetical protein [Rubripirellula reticaptiva]|uniref:Lipocalin-like domain-containing protein n=1 Tax=Rubripirellula reticaptiva TaxID=2528013 RepID=A0A5C6EL05_9BACT|nr:hypothetical protein [Rubripirellula reticaptiva]TWU49144.1 hypothetical protein Poly59_37580 [Rubripirellula reticaptiva]